jgi:hypothetical protein
MRKLLFLILFIIFTGCFRDEEINNTPIKIPEYVGFLMFRDLEAPDHTHKIAVIDLEKDSIIGEHIVTRKGFIESFCLGPDGMLYIPYECEEFPIAGKIVSVFDPEMGEEICRINTPRSPVTIHRLPNDEAFIFHYFRPFGDSDWVNSVIDLKTRTFKKKIYGLWGTSANQEIIYSSDSSKIWITDNEPHPSIVRFYPDVDTVGETYQFQWEYNGETPRFISCRFITDTKFYALTECPVGLFIYDFPSCSIKKFIPFDIGSYFILQLPNDKAYISHTIWTEEPGSGVIDNYITVINTETDEVIKRIYFNDFYGPYWMAYSKELNKVYVSSDYQYKIAVINPDNDSVIKIIKPNKNREISAFLLILNK